ncbi:MAG: hypothetical protein ABH842_01890 [Candidatus Micrarchaeota archaeon]
MGLYISVLIALALVLMGCTGNNYLYSVVLEKGGMECKFIIDKTGTLEYEFSSATPFGHNLGGQQIKQTVYMGSVEVEVGEKYVLFGPSTHEAITIKSNYPIECLDTTY